MGKHKKEDKTRMDIDLHIMITKREGDMLESLLDHYNVSKSYFIRHIIADKYFETFSRKND
jgi:hypothetical protein